MSETQREPCLQGLNILWAEYSYRHEHFWNNMYKLLVAALALAVVPYLKLEMPGNLKWFLLIPPILSVLLLVLSYPRVTREFDLLKEVKAKYRDWQTQLYGISHGKGSFAEHVRNFWIILVLVSAGNLWVSLAWISKISNT